MCCGSMLVPGAEEHEGGMWRRRGLPGRVGGAVRTVDGMHLGLGMKACPDRPDA